MRPIEIAALFSVIGLVACSDMPPPIAKDLHGDAFALEGARQHGHRNRVFGDQH